MLRAGFVMQGLGPLEQHLQRKLASPDMLDAHADQLLVVRDHHRLDRLEDLVDTFLGQRNFAFGQLCLEMRQQRPIARLERLGLVNDRLVAVHMTQLTEAEIHLCAERGVSVVHCPESNLKLASGFCPACALQRAGVNLAIGTDGVASNNDLDMFGETRTAAILAKAVAKDAAGFDAFSALHAATLGGAKAMGFDHMVGSLEPGKQADIACVDLSALETQPLHHVVSQLIYATGRQQVSDVWIAGKPKLSAIPSITR